MRLPDDFLKSVCFLCVKQIRDGQERYQYGGTAFFVSIPSEVYPNDVAYLYAVTARHNVVKASELGCAVELRLNQSDGGIGFLKIDTDWYYPENPAVDVAVLPWPPGVGSIFDFKCFPAGAFATDVVITKQAIGVGDELMIVGLFSQRYGSARNHPIVRSGAIAAMPGEPFQDDSGDLYHAYLAEVRSLGGLSGSPVTVALDPLRPGAGPHGMPPAAFSGFYLLGLVRGHWDLKKRETTVGYADDELHQVNMGVAIVTPIQDVIGVLMSDELRKKRKEGDQAAAKQMQPTLGSGDAERGKPQRTPSQSRTP